MRERGAVIIDGPAGRVYGQRELIVEDCDGRVLAFGEDTTNSGARGRDSSLGRAIGRDSRIRFNDEAVRVSDSGAPPRRLHTDRLVLRCWEPGDIALLKHALDLSVEHLHPWVPWARLQPYDIEWVVEKIQRHRADFDARKHFVYGLFDPDESEVMGGAGLYRRVGPGALEVGYWIRVDRAGRGLATEAARILSSVAFEALGARLLEMHIDPANARSLAIPPKIGYLRRRPARVEAGMPLGDGEGTLVYELTAERYASGPTFRHQSSG